MDDTERAYFAGFFDGEGSITKRPGRNTFSIEVVQVDRRPLDQLAMAYGGSILVHSPATEKHRASWRWCLHGGSREFLVSVRPWLIVKAAQADEVLALVDSRYGRY